MTSAEGDINQLVYEATVARIREFCERRLGQGASNAELNAELKSYIPLLNAWSRRQRTMLKLLVLDDASAHRLQ